MVEPRITKAVGVKLNAVQHFIPALMFLAKPDDECPARVAVEQ